MINKNKKTYNVKIKNNIKISIIHKIIISIMFVILFVLTIPKANAQIFNQTIILNNSHFDYNINYWENNSEYGNPIFYWIDNDGSQSGVAQIIANGNLSNFTGSIYQKFNLSTPIGTLIENLTFSAMWRIAEFDDIIPATIFFSIENNSNVTSCIYTNQSSTNTSWIMTTLNTDGSNNCFIQNFTANELYTIKLKCELTTTNDSINESCNWDNITAKVFYTDIEPPSIIFANASPSIVNLSDKINFTANVSDNLQIDKVWLSIEENNYTMIFSEGLYYFYNFNTTIYPQLYLYMIYANDTSNLSSNYSGNFTVIDITSPSIIINFPENNQTSQNNITFNYTPSDYNLYNCSLYINSTGIFEVNNTDSNPINNENNYFNLYLNYGSYLWNIYCCDFLDNCGFNSTNKTLHISPDIAIIEGDVSLSNIYPIHGEIVTIDAKIRNLDNITIYDVPISFYDGNPYISGVLINISYINLTPFGIISTNVTWSALRGTHEIYAVININRTITELNYSNNFAFNTTYILSWHTYYGNITAVMSSISKMFSNSTFQMINWSINADPNIQANIYITDSVATISWDKLQALGLDIFNQSTINTTNDYTELDWCLNSSTYPDNINITYSNFTTRYSTYNIYSRNISNVSEIPSTNNTNFYTGLLWDTSIGYEYYNCSENKSQRPNIIFVTKVNHSSHGKYGIYDYEIKIPEEIGNYKGLTNKVNIYYEFI